MPKRNTVNVFLFRGVLHLLRAFVGVYLDVRFCSVFDRTVDKERERERKRERERERERLSVREVVP